MAMAVQQLYVRLQQLQGTLVILRSARSELVKQVQNATSTTTHEEPMKRAVRLFKLRSYLGAVDQRNELEPTTTEESSTRDARHADVLHTRDDGDSVQVSQCRCKRGVRSS